MNKTLKEAILYFLMVVFFFFLPNLMYYHFSAEREETTYKRIKEDYEDCLQKAERKKVDTVFCDEIKAASNRIYDESRNAGKSIRGIVLQIFPMILAILMMAVINLRKQIDELKEKLNV